MKKQYQNEPKAPKKQPPVRLLLSLLLSVSVIFLIYRVVAVELQQGWMFWVYYGLTLAIGLLYIFYNFGLSRRNLTYEMLPKEWSKEEKDRFLRETAERKKKSRFLLVLLFGFLFTFFMDIIELFLPNMLKTLFPWLS